MEFFLILGNSKAGVFRRKGKGGKEYHTQVVKIDIFLMSSFLLEIEKALN